LVDLVVAGISSARHQLQSTCPHRLHYDLASLYLRRLAESVPEFWAAELARRSIGTGLKAFGATGCRLDYLLGELAIEVDFVFH